MRGWLVGCTFEQERECELKEQSRVRDKTYVDQGCSSYVVGDALECKLERVAEKSVIQERVVSKRMSSASVLR